jgi:hypothetical protein
MKTVLCATDASPMAINAANYATLFCERMHMPLVCLPQTLAANLFTTPRQQTEGNNLTVGSQQGFAQQETSSDTDTITDPALRLQAILSLAKVAQREDAGLFITGVEKDFSYQNILGQEIIELTRKARCPVLLIPEGVVFRPIRRILMVIDHEFNIGPRMPFIADIARSLGAEIELFQINKKDEIGQEHPFYQSSLDLYLAFDYESIHFHETSSEPVPAAIRRLTEKTQADLVIMVPDLEEHLPASPMPEISYKNLASFPLTIPLLAIDADAVQAAKNTGYPFN